MTGSWKDRLSYLRTLTGIAHGSRAFGGPVQVSLSITNRCNIRCIHCFYYSPFLERPTRIPLKRARMRGLQLPDNKFLKHMHRFEADANRLNYIIDELVKMGTRRFQLSGGGEPFFHKNAMEFMARIKRDGCFCVALTNGTLLDETTIDELIKMGFDELRITTMAGSAEMYLETHPGVSVKTFDCLKDNLIYLAERKKALGVKHPK